EAIGRVPGAAGELSQVLYCRAARLADDRAIDPDGLVAETSRRVACARHGVGAAADHRGRRVRRLRIGRLERLGDLAAGPGLQPGDDSAGLGIETAERLERVDRVAEPARIRNTRSRSDPGEAVADHVRDREGVAARR